MGDWSDYVLACPDLLSACKNSSRPEARTFSSEDMRLTVAGDRALLFDRFDAKAGLARDWTDSFVLALMINGFRCFMGETWSPEHVYSSAQIENGIENYFDTQATPDPNKSGCGIAFPSEILTTALQSHITEETGSANGIVMPSSLVAQIECVIEAIQPGQRVTLDRTAEMMDVAPRTLQRQLQELGT